MKDQLDAHLAMKYVLSTKCFAMAMAMDIDNIALLTYM